MRRLLAAALALYATGAGAEVIDQDGWSDRKEIVKLDNGQKLAVVEYGDPAGKPVILLHGLTDTSRSWSLLSPALAEFRVIIPDQRGHGAASKPECCYSLADYADDLRLLMDELKIERAAIAGHSLGSMVAMEFAGTWPDRVEKLVLAASTGKAPVSHGHWLVEGALALRDPIDPNGDFIGAWFSPENVAKTPVDPDFLKHFAVEGRAVPAYVWRGVIGGLIDLPAARHASRIKAPALILAGEQDELFDASHQQALRAAFPQADYVAFERLGHNLIWEETDSVAAPIVEFLKR